MLDGANITILFDSFIRTVQINGPYLSSGEVKLMDCPFSFVKQQKPRKSHNFVGAIGCCGIRVPMNQNSDLNQLNQLILI